RKLGIAFLAVVATIVAMSAAIYWNLSATRVAQEQRVVVNDILAGVRGAEFRLARQENSYRGFLLSNDAFYIGLLEKHRGLFDQHLDDLRSMAAGEETLIAHVDSAAAAMDAWWVNIVEVGKRLAADPITRFQAVEMIGQTGIADGYMEKIEIAIGLISEDAAARITAARVAAEEAVTFNERVLIGGLTLAVLISAGLGWLLSRMIA